MKRFIIIMIFCLIAAVIFNILLDSSAFFTAIVNTLSVWLYKVYPSIFTFYLIAVLLINTKIIDRFVYYLRAIFKKLKFKNENGLHLFFLSIFTGNPGSAALIGDAIISDAISTADANQLLKFSSFINPLFIISYLGPYNIKYAIILIFVHITANFLIAFFTNRNNQPTIITKKPIAFSLNEFLDSLNKLIGVLLMISAVMVIANIVYYSLVNILSFLGEIPLLIKIVLANLEISAGLNHILALRLSFKITLLLFAFLTGFGGLSIHLQVYNVIAKYNLSYSVYFKYRLTQGIIAVMLLLPFLMLG